MAAVIDVDSSSADGTSHILSHIGNPSDLHFGPQLNQPSVHSDSMVGSRISATCGTASRPRSGAAAAVTIACGSDTDNIIISSFYNDGVLNIGSFYPGGDNTFSAG